MVNFCPFFFFFFFCSGRLKRQRGEVQLQDKRVSFLAPQQNSFSCRGKGVAEMRYSFHFSPLFKSSEDPNDFGAARGTEEGWLRCSTLRVTAARDSANHRRPSAPSSRARPQTPGGSSRPAAPPNISRCKRPNQETRRDNTANQGLLTQASLHPPPRPQ